MRNPEQTWRMHGVESIFTFNIPTKFKNKTPLAYLQDPYRQVAVVYKDCLQALQKVSQQEYLIKKCVN